MVMGAAADVSVVVEAGALAALEAVFDAPELDVPDAELSVAAGPGQPLRSAAADNKMGNRTSDLACIGC